jgi:hypothetical protein
MSGKYSILTSICAWAIHIHWACVMTSHYLGLYCSLCLAEGVRVYAYEETNSNSFQSFKKNSALFIFLHLLILKIAVLDRTRLWLLLCKYSIINSCIYPSSLTSVVVGFVENILLFCQTFIKYTTLRWGAWG